MNNSKKDRRDDERRPQKRRTEGTIRESRSSKQGEKSSSRKAATKEFDKGNNPRTELRKPRTESNTKNYHSDTPKRKANSSRTPKAKPGPFDKFDIQKMREAKAESLEKKERRRRPSKRTSTKVTEQRSDKKIFERGFNSELKKPRRGSERNTYNSIHKSERTEKDTERTKRFDRAKKEIRSGKTYTKKESIGFERKKPNPDEEIRLNRYIANSGVCSRRKADELIQNGEITVNGEVIKELGFKVKYSDKVKYDGKLLKPGKLVYILLNKPKDYITTLDDPMERKTVVELTSKITNERIFPVGRLDRNTTGLLLLTNDGELADKLSHPRNQVKKVYEVELDRSLQAKDFEKIREGVELEDGAAKVDEISYLEGKSKKFVGVEIHIGRNRIVRRIFESLGYEVVRLDRVIYAGLTKKDLPRGRSRMLTKEEIIYLKHLNKY